MVVSILRGLRAPSRSLLATLVFALCLGAATPALASAGTGRALGIIAVHGTRSVSANSIEFNVPGVAPQSAAAKSHKGGGTPSPSTVNPLTYHGGSVFTSPYKIYDIYWVPAGYTVPSGYQSTIDGFVQNVSTDSGKTTNVFYAASQYYNGAGSHVPYAASFGGSVTAADPFPASGCTDSALPAGAPCLADTQVSTEIKAVATAHGWTIGYPNIFVIMMPKGVGNCASYSTGGLEGYCSFTNACAWHHQWSSLYFAVQPYVGNVSGCQSGQGPTGVYDADQAINTMSHELNESVTDPAGGSWYDINGYENGDKCAWNFGSVLGGTSGQLYNQVINGAHYFLQQEWSNQSSGCVLTGA